jgi:hypothetical protein
MIRIITPGRTDFRITCDKCGCVFEYNVEDIDDGFVKCPTCHKKHYGFEPDEDLTEGPNNEPVGEKGEQGNTNTLKLDKEYKLSDYITPCIAPSIQYTPNYKHACDGCPTYQKMCSPGGYIGDLPCTWCAKNPYRVTCDYLSSDYATTSTSGTPYQYSVTAKNTLDATNYYTDCTCASGGTCTHETEERASETE